VISKKVLVFDCLCLIIRSRVIKSGGARRRRRMREGEIERDD